MISLDSNVVLSALNSNDVNHGRALKALNQNASQAYCICPVVRAELRASGSWAAIDAWLSLQGVSVLWEMPEAAWDNAGEAFGKYSKLRKTGTWPRRLVADFLIAAHAQFHELEMLTFDDTVFKAGFPSVTLQAI